MIFESAFPENGFGRRFENGTRWPGGRDMARVIMFPVWPTLLD